LRVGACLHRFIYRDSAVMSVICNTTTTTDERKKR
jgi:hypothetical protein